MQVAVILQPRGHILIYLHGSVVIMSMIHNWLNMGEINKNIKFKEEAIMGWRKQVVKMEMVVRKSLSCFSPGALLAEI